MKVSIILAGLQISITHTFWWPFDSNQEKGVVENLRMPPRIPDRNRPEPPHRHRPPPAASNLRHTKPPDIGKGQRLNLNNSNFDNHNLEGNFDETRKNFGLYDNSPSFEQEISNRRGAQQPLNQDRLRIDNNDRTNRPDRPRLNSELSEVHQSHGGKFRNKPQHADSDHNDHRKDDKLDTKGDMGTHPRPKIRFDEPNKEHTINHKSERDNQTEEHDNMDTKTITENNSDIFHKAGVPQRLFSIDGTPASTMDSLFLEHVADLVASTVSEPLKYTNTNVLSPSDATVDNENLNATLNPEIKTVHENVDDKVEQIITPLPMKDNSEKMPINDDLATLQIKKNSATMPIMPREMIHETPKNSNRFRNIYKEVQQKSQRSRKPPPAAQPVDYFDYYYYYDELIPIDRMGDYYLYYDEYPEQRTFDVRPFSRGKKEEEEGSIINPLAALIAPLAGLALLGAASAVAVNPILLQLVTINKDRGKREAEPLTDGQMEGLESLAANQELRAKIKELRVLESFMRSIPGGGSQADMMTAGFLTCTGLMEESNGCLELLTCTYTAQQSFSNAEKDVTSIVLYSLMRNKLLPPKLKGRLRHAARTGRDRQECSQFTCNFEPLQTWWN